MTNANLKKEIRLALKSNGEKISTSKATMVRSFHNASTGWNIYEFAGQVKMNYIRNGMGATTPEDLARGFAILANAGLGVEISQNAISVQS